MNDQATFPTKLYHHCSSLVGKVASEASDLDIWTVVAQLLVAFENIEAKSPIRKLHENWTSGYLPESLEVLQHMTQGNNNMDSFYAKTKIFVQSSGMGKSRLADAFGKECPMVNFVLREERTLDYPPADSEVLSFMLKRLSVQDRKKITDTPTENLSSKRIPGTEDEIFPERMVTTVWDHSIAVGLLQASFEFCKLRPLFITTKAQVLIQNNVRHSQCVGHTRKF